MYLYKPHSVDDVSQSLLGHCAKERLLELSDFIGILFRSGQCIMHKNGCSPFLSFYVMLLFIPSHNKVVEGI